MMSALLHNIKCCIGGTDIFSIALNVTRAAHRQLDSHVHQ